MPQIRYILVICLAFFLFIFNGVVTAHAEGSATITVTTLDGNITAHGTVTVTGNNMGGSGDRQAYFENRFPGRDVVILPDYGVLYAADGNTIIVGGRGDDWIEMSGGGNIFIYETGGGHDVVRSINAEENANELHFGPGITRDDLSFLKKGNDLYIYIAGEENGSVTIINWYVAEQYRLRLFLYDGTEVTVTYETPENASGGGCNVAGYVFSMWLALLLVVSKRKR